MVILFIRWLKSSGIAIEVEVAFLVLLNFAAIMNFFVVPCHQKVFTCVLAELVRIML
jgi:hypothetical protein